MALLEYLHPFVETFWFAQCGKSPRLGVVHRSTCVSNFYRSYLQSAEGHVVFGHLRSLWEYFVDDNVASFWVASKGLRKEIANREDRLLTVVQQERIRIGSTFSILIESIIVW